MRKFWGNCMGEEPASVEHEANASAFLLKVAAQIAVVGAATMGFFHFYSESIYLATFGFVASAILGSLLAWRSAQASRLLIFASVLVIEWIVVERAAPSLAVVFVLGDALLLLFLGSGFAKEMKERKG